MGLSFAFIVCTTDGHLDLRRPGSIEDAHTVMERLYPRTAHEYVHTQRLLDACWQPKGMHAIGVFDDGVLIATKDAHLYDPAILHRRYLRFEEWPVVQLLTSASYNNMFAYGRWASGVLTRSLSVNAVAGVWRDTGVPAFDGDSAVSDARWLDLCNAALASALSLEGDVAPSVSDAVDWDDVALHVFARADRSR